MWSKKNSVVQAFLAGLVAGCFLTYNVERSLHSYFKWIDFQSQVFRKDAQVQNSPTGQNLGHPYHVMVPIEDSDDAEGDGELLKVINDESDEIAISRDVEVSEDATETAEAQVGFHPILWEDVDEKYKLNEDRILEQKRMWKEGQAERPLFFFYQPSGGWGNQRYELMWAIIAANAMNRTLILPPIAPHSSLWHGFNKWPASALLPMARVLNMEALNRVVHKGVISFNDTIYSLKNYLPRMNIFTYRRPESAGWWSFQKIRNEWMTNRNRKYDVIFWEKDSMWCCCGASGPFKDYYSRHVMFNTYVKQLARRLIHEATTDPINNPNGTYNAIHVRRGDHITGDRKSPMRYYREHDLGRFDKRLPLYVATDETDVSWFEIWKQPRYKFFTKMIFWKNLNQNWINNALKYYPEEMHGDVLGFLEIIIGAFAKRWEGSKGSTFSAAIARSRIRKELRAVVFPWPQRPSVSQ